jgi:long-chain acyl-CoA synthetase
VNLARLLLRSAATAGDRPAIVLGTRVLHDYGALARRAAGLATSLRATLGLAAGDRVALYARNCAEYLEVMYAAWIAGLAVVPINHKLHPRELAYIVEDSGAAALVVSDGVAAIDARSHAIEIGSRDYERLVDAPPWPMHEAAPDDVAWLFYTSGTTGRPKGVMLTHRNLYAMTLCYFADVDAARAEDAAIYAGPMSHGAGLYNFPNVLVAARHVVPESGAFDADEFLALAGHHRNATAFAAPTMVKRLVERAPARALPDDAIRTIVYGGGPMYVADIRRALDVMGQRFVQIYGQGESPMTITVLSRGHHADRMHPDYEARLGSVGIAQSVVDVRVVDAQGRASPAGEPGEIVVRGDSVMRGYWGDAEATSETLRGGWLHTGDVGAFDGHGFLTLKDRSKDLVISGGANVFPREVEEALLAHPGVDEACVVGRAHAEWGEEVVAFVVRRAGAHVDEAALDRACLERIARFKRPRVYRFVEALPKNNYGKVLKREVRRWLEEEGKTAGPSPGSG